MAVAATCTDGGGDDFVTAGAIAEEFDSTVTVGTSAGVRSAVIPVAPLARAFGAAVALDTVAIEGDAAVPVGITLGECCAFEVGRIGRGGSAFVLVGTDSEATL